MVVTSNSSKPHIKIACRYEAKEIITVINYVTKLNQINIDYKLFSEINFLHICQPHMPLFVPLLAITFLMFVTQQNYLSSCMIAIHTLRHTCDKII